ncbi:MAG TPA: tryptophan synthase subunit alpha [Bacillota bacterium]|nr:tryptophan synthase subunit alpha [Bacillota bacterium]
MGRLKDNLLVQTFTRLQAEGRKALITYVTAGDPSLADTEAIVLELSRAGADVVELGVPFSDPVADGPVIQQASQRALRAGTTVQGILELAARLRKQTQVPLVLMTYINPLLQYEIKRFMAQAAVCGINGLILPDLPVEEWGLVEEAAQANGIALIPLVAPTSTTDRLQKICARGSGFVYCVSLTGVTGIRSGLPSNVAEFLGRVRAATDLPLAVGFGISNPEQITGLKGHCDGVVVGSALVDLLARAGTSAQGLEQLGAFIATLKSALI